MSAFVAILLALSTSGPPTKVVQAFDFFTSNVAVPQSARNATEDFPVLGIKEGQVLKLEAQEIQLTETIVLPLSNIVVDGGPTMTVVRCPPRRSAFTIQGTNVTLVRLKIVDCYSAPAIVVRNTPVSRLGHGRFQTLDESENLNVEWKHKVSIESCQFKNNTSSTGSKGGAIFAEYALLKVKDSTFSGNKAGLGGAVFITNSLLWIAGSSFSSNVATSGGGALRMVGSKAIVTSCSFSANNGTWGGAVSMKYSCSLEAVNVTLEENRATRNGGAIGSFVHSSLNLTDAKFIRNHAGDGGGGVFAERSTVELMSVLFSLNTAQKGGGALRMMTSKATLMNCSFFASRAIWGGAVSIKSSSGLVAVNVTLVENFAAQNGGAIGVFLRSSLNLTGAKFTRNQAGNSGGGIFAERSTVGSDERLVHKQHCW